MSKLGSLKIKIDVSGQIYPSDKARSYVFRLLSFLPCVGSWSTDIYFGKRYRYYKRLLKKFQYYSNKQIDDYQNECLRKIIKYAYNYVPFYKKTFNKLHLFPKDIKTKEDLIRLPLLRKQTIRENFDEFRSSEYKNYRFKKEFTGGTTGEPLAFLLDYETIDVGRAVLNRWYNWIGIKENYKVAKLEVPLGIREGKVNLQILALYFPINRIIEINTARVTSEYLEKIVNLLNLYQPEVIQGYPDTLFILASYIKNNKIAFYQPKLIRCGAEALYEHQRKLYQQVFRCNVYDFYGMEEHVCFANECKEGNLHYSPELGILEIIKDGRPCKEGEVGEIVGTHLHNKVMPFIRYAVCDYGQFIKEKCKCGVNLPIIKIIGAREKDILMTEKGPYFATYMLLHSLHEQFKIKSLQFYQENKQEVMIKVVKDKGYKVKNEEALKNRLNAYFDNELKVIIKHVDEISHSERGKYKLVESKVPFRI